MKNNYIFLELNQNNEFRADVNMIIKSMDITAIENINIKIDTGCPYTSIPVLKLGISSMKAQQMKQKDCADSTIRKEISFGGIHVEKDFVKVSYDRTGNILIGMDILSKLDIHIGKSKLLGKTIFLACPNDRINQEYLSALKRHFEL